MMLYLAEGLAFGVDEPEKASSPCPEPITFPTGNPDDVARQTAIFLTKAEGIETHPYWPQNNSGITLGVGWDAGQHSKEELAATWAQLNPSDVQRLKQAAGVKGADAAKLLPKIRDIVIPKELSLKVLQASIIEYLPLMQRTFPGAEKLPTEAQVAIISVLFNRGEDMGHEPDWKIAKAVDRRWEMREFRDDVRRQDMFAIYVHLNTMKRIWTKKNERGLLIRRRDESALIRPYVDKQLRVDDERERLNCH